MSEAVTGIELPHSNLLQTQSTLLFPITSCVFHFTTSLLYPYFPLIILPPGFFSYYFPHLFPFPYSLPHFHPVVQSLVSLILNCGQVKEAFHDFLELSRWIPKQYLEICCHYFLLIFHFHLTEHYLTFAIPRYSWPCAHNASVPKEMSCRLLLLTSLAPGDSTQYPQNGRLGSLYHWSGHLGHEINLPARNWIMIHQLSSLSHSHYSNNTDSTWDYAICAVSFVTSKSVTHT